MRWITMRSVSRPSTKIAGASTRALRYGSIPQRWCIQKEPNIASMMNSPWAKFTIRRTPKISVSPIDIRP